jgi:hypothetical protein
MKGVTAMSISNIDPVVTKDEAGMLHKRVPVLPNRWKGETDCLVGPFSDASVAQYFAGYVVDFGQYSAYSYNVFVSYDSWYVEISGFDIANETLAA